VKKYLALTSAFLIFAAAAANTIWAQDEIYTNKNAPANYDANLKAGDKAIGVILGSPENVIIVSKSGNIYRAKNDTGRDIEYLLHANAVYPYFDLYEFQNIISGNEDLVMPYVECYAKKHGWDFEKLKGIGYRERYYHRDIKNELQEEQAKLVQLESRLKSLPARPDTYLEFNQNPAVWYEIAINRAEYLSCALSEQQVKDFKESPWLRAHKDGIQKVLRYVENYRAGSGDSMGTESEYALYAVSPKERTAWLKDKNALQLKDEVDKLLKPLAAALAQKLPTYQPRMEKYSFGTATDFALMKKAFSNPARYKIFKTGLMQNVWQIDKNSLGIPNARYKNGAFYLHDTQADHPYCYLTYVNIIQDYSGGGIYAASRAKYIQDELVACPAEN
jgi:hypothetical protein